MPFVSARRMEVYFLQLLVRQFAPARTIRPWGCEVCTAASTAPTYADTSVLHHSYSRTVAQVCDLRLRIWRQSSDGAPESTRVRETCIQCVTLGAAQKEEAAQAAEATAGDGAAGAGAGVAARAAMGT